MSGVLPKIVENALERRVALRQFDRSLAHDDPVVGWLMTIPLDAGRKSRTKVSDESLGRSGDAGCLFHGMAGVTHFSEFLTRLYALVPTACRQRCIYRVPFVNLPQNDALRQAVWRDLHHERLQSYLNFPIPLAIAALIVVSASHRANKCNVRCAASCHTVSPSPAHRKR
jgi:hypothetical protein